MTSLRPLLKHGYAESFDHWDGSIAVPETRLFERVGGDYLLTDSHTWNDLVILDNDFSIFRDTWRIRDADDRSVVAEINSRGALVTLARKCIPFGELIPHKQEITDPNGDHVGSIHGQFSLRDGYAITIDGASNAPKEQPWPRRW